MPVKSLSRHLRVANDRTAIIIVWVLRLIVGAIFIFSGWVKAVDIWGGSYKIAEYFASWNLSLPESFIVICASAMAMAEFLAGAMIILGCFRRMVIYLTSAFMACMTLLTLYLWIANPVKDCGCFGDAIVLSNAATFWKNIVIDIMLLFLWFNNHRAHSLIYHRLQWLAVIATITYIGYIEYLGYNIQPPVDFRGYTPGQNILPTDSDTDDIRFVYAHNGIERAFAADSLPDEDTGWTFVRRESTGEDTRKSIVITEPAGEDITENIINDTGVQIILLVPDTKEYGRTRSAMANEIYDVMQTNYGGNTMFAVVAGNYNTASEWADEVRAHYPVYTAEDTDIKILARGKGAMIFVRDGRIVWKQTTTSLPPDLGIRIMQDGIEALDNASYIDALSLTSTTRNASLYYALAIIALIILTTPQAIRHLFVRKRKAADKQV